jgi:hypothetical protein
MMHRLTITVDEDDFPLLVERKPQKWRNDVASVFAVTTSNDSLPLKGNGSGEATFTVTNTSARPLRGIARPKALGNTKKEWLKLAGDNEHDFAAGGTRQFSVALSVPADAPPGKYSFRLDAFSASNPDEDFTEGPTVSAEVLPAPPKPPSKAWIIPVALMAVLIIVATVVLIFRGGSKQQEVKKQPPPLVKPAVKVVTLGDGDQGKTTLMAAIIKVLSQAGKARSVAYEELIDPPEIEVQGVKVRAAEVEYDTDKAHYIHVGGHNQLDYLKLLTSSGVMFDGAILIISAQDGPMPATREQIINARNKGIKSIVVYLDNVDMVNDPELLQLVELEVHELLDKYDFKQDNVSIVRGSASKALAGSSDEIGKDSILELLKAMDMRFAK